jgi:hypothetical protein
MPLQTQPRIMKDQIIEIDYQNLFEDIPLNQREELIKYHKILEELAKSELNVQFKNEGENHAAVVMSLLFNHSKEFIKIFAGQFNGDVSNKKVYKDALKKAIETDGKKLEVIFEKNPNRESGGFILLRQLQTNFPDRVSIKIANAEQLKEYKNILKDKEMVHFSVGDDCIYRYETDTVNFKAFCDFNDKKFANRLNDLFSILSSNAKDIIN